LSVETEAGGKQVLPATSVDEASQLWRTVADLARQTNDLCVSERIDALIKLVLSADLVPDEHRCKAADLLKIHTRTHQGRSCILHSGGLQQIVNAIMDPDLCASIGAILMNMAFADGLVFGPFRPACVFGASSARLRVWGVECPLACLGRRVPACGFGASCACLRAWGVVCKQ
jgi:hypothetical protein